MSILFIQSSCNIFFNTIKHNHLFILYILSYEVLNKGIRVALLSFVVTRQPIKHLIIVFVMSDFAVPSFLKVFFLVENVFINGFLKFKLYCIA